MAPRCQLYRGSTVVQIAYVLSYRHCAQRAASIIHIIIIMYVGSRNDTHTLGLNLNVPPLHHYEQ